MTQEEKQLLLRDLCARLPYGVKGIRTYRPEETVTLGAIIPRCKMNPNVGNGSFCELGFDDTLDCCVIAEFKPHLRSMSSITEKEEEEFKQVLEIELDYLASEETGHTVKSATSSAFVIDFYNAHHFDYRGLIPMGLAIEAPEGMYKTE